MIKLLTAVLLALAAPAAAQTGCLVSGALDLETPRVGVTPAYVAANCVNRSLIKLSTSMASAADFTALSDSTEALQVALDAETAARIAADYAVGEATDTLDGDLTDEVSARQTLALLTASTTDALQVEVDGKAPLTGEGTSGTWGISVTGSAGSATGNAGTATALAADGANCSAGSYPLGVDASGAAQSCTAAPEVSTATVVLNPAGFVPAGLIPTLNQNTSGNAGTATALAADGANCSAGSYPLGVDASGAAQSCTAAPEVSTATVVLNPAGFVPAGLIPTLNQNTSGNAGTATALAANAANCGAGQAAQGVDASGAAEGCYATATDISSKQDLNTHLTDLADGTLTGSKVGSGVPAANIADGTMGTVNTGGNAATATALAADPADAASGYVCRGINAAGVCQPALVEDNVVNGSTNPVTGNAVFDAIAGAGGGDVTQAGDNDFTGSNGHYGTETFQTPVRGSSGVVVGNPDGTLINGGASLAIYAVSFDGASQSSGCVVVVNISGSNGDAAAYAKFTSTTTVAYDFQSNQNMVGVLLEACAPGAACRVGIGGIFRVPYSTALTSGYGRTSDTRCAVLNGDNSTPGTNPAKAFGSSSSGGFAWISLWTQRF